MRSAVALVDSSLDAVEGPSCTYVDQVDEPCGKKLDVETFDAPP